MSMNLTATPLERDVVFVTGQDAPGYLQTQLTQDMLSLPRGRSRWSFILTPKSEIEAIVRVTRTVDGFILDAAPGYGDRVRGRLDGPLFRMDVVFSQDTWPGVAWRGEGANDVEGDAPIMAPLPWSDGDALDEVGPSVQLPSDFDSLTSDELDALRIAAAWPSEAEFGGKATPAMTGIVERTVSFEKGCYTGQEFVARVHYRDADPPRRLVVISFDPGSDLEAGTHFVAFGEDVGVMTSVAPAAGIGLGYCKRAVPDGSEVSVGSVAATITCALV